MQRYCTIAHVHFSYMCPGDSLDQNGGSTPPAVDPKLQSAKRLLRIPPSAIFNALATLSAALAVLSLAAPQALLNAGKPYVLMHSCCPDVLWDLDGSCGNWIRGPCDKLLDPMGTAQCIPVSRSQFGAMSCIASSVERDTLHALFKQRQSIQGLFGLCSSGWRSA